MQTDLFDQTEAQGPGERQTDLEDLIAQPGFPRDGRPSIDAENTRSIMWATWNMRLSI